MHNLDYTVDVLPKTDNLVKRKSDEGGRGYEQIKVYMWPKSDGLWQIKIPISSASWLITISVSFIWNILKFCL